MVEDVEDGDLDEDVAAMDSDLEVDEDSETMERRMAAQRRDEKLARYRQMLAKNRMTLPQLPEMRYEQSYLLSIAHAESWSTLLWITLRDTVLSPFVQGAFFAGLALLWRQRRLGRIEGGRAREGGSLLRRRRPFILQARDLVWEKWSYYTAGA